MAPDASTPGRPAGRKPAARARTPQNQLGPANPTPPTLSLSVQYGVAEPLLPRWRLRRWASHTLATLAQQNAMKPGHLPRAVVLTLRLVGAAEGRRLNRTYRDRDYATNVLTFEYGADPDGVRHGDVILCVPVLKREAREQQKTLLAHAAHLTVHGVLHALGYDHIDASEAEAMENLEVDILARLRIANPYHDPPSAP